MRWLSPALAIAVFGASVALAAGTRADEIAKSNEVQLAFKEPIGIRVDINPFADANRPSRVFQERVDRQRELFAGQLAADDDSGYAQLASAEISDQPVMRPPAVAYAGDVLRPIISAPAPTYDEQMFVEQPFAYGNDIHIDHGVFKAAMQQPLAPLQPLQPVQPQSIAPYEPQIPSTISSLSTTSIAELAAAVGGSPAQGVSAAQAQAIAPTDLGGLLQSASSINTVNTTRRSPVALAPTVRGYKFGEVYTQATGAYWFPVREDLDSMLSKIDPGMVQEVVVIPGPYGLRYGPGFSFIDIITQDTPRYNDGYGSEYRLNGNVRTNGGQLYGRATAEGGNCDYGYRISYGHRKGSDYEAGNGLNIPSSYDSGDVWAQFGFNTSKYQKVEWSFLRLDGANTEYAAQFFDIDTLGTFGTTLRATDEDPASPWDQFVLEGWWNRTNFTGSITPEKSQPDFPVITRVEFSLDQTLGGNNTLNGNTLGSNVSSGARSVVRYGDLDSQFLRLGADFHFMEQGLRENYTITNTDPMNPTLAFSTNLPFSQINDEGLFAEYCIVWNDYAKTTLGGRADLVTTGAALKDIRPDTNLPIDELQQNDELYSYYVTNELKVADSWTLDLGYGYAQRPPTLTERYADGVFLGLLQSGFTRVIGTPDLKPERNFQLDGGLHANYDNFRGSLTGFYAFVIDYVTFDGIAVTDFFDAKLVRYRNTPLATLAGFEAAMDFDWSSNLAPFAKLKYVEGTDQFVGPLFAIPPLEGTVGLRWHDSTKERRWEFEVGTRIVNQQNRLGEILVLGDPTVIEERTGGFTTTYLRSYYNWTDNLKLIAGIDNVFNRSYQEHLDLRLLGPTGFPAPPTRVLSPGFTPYFGLDWSF
jgi:iron complex outermembrane receptor protein